MIPRKEIKRGNYIFDEFYRKEDGKLHKVEVFHKKNRAEKVAGITLTKHESFEDEFYEFDNHTFASNGYDKQVACALGEYAVYKELDKVSTSCQMGLCGIETIQTPIDNSTGTIRPFCSLEETFTPYESTIESTSSRLPSKFPSHVSLNMAVVRPSLKRVKLPAQIMDVFEIYGEQWLKGGRRPDLPKKWLLIEGLEEIVASGKRGGMQESHISTKIPFVLFPDLKKVDRVHLFDEVGDKIYNYYKKKGKWESVTKDYTYVWTRFPKLEGTMPSMKVYETIERIKFNEVGSFIDEELRYLDRFGFDNNIFYWSPIEGSLDVDLTYTLKPNTYSDYSEPQEEFTKRIESQLKEFSNACECKVRLYNRLRVGGIHQNLLFESN